MKARQSSVIASIIFLGLLSGCKSSGEKESSSIVSTVSAVSVSSNLEQCNDGHAGAVVFDRSQATFFACDGREWAALDLRGQKGDKGDRGDVGQQGPTGANGRDGVDGRDGRDGIDGNGVHLALREGAAIRAVLIQFHESAALVMLPTGEMVYVDANTGEYTGRADVIYYTGSNCTGEAYADPDHRYFYGFTVDRIFVGVDNNLKPVAFYKVVSAQSKTITAMSHRGYDTYGQMGRCDNYNYTDTRVRLFQVEQIPPLPSLTHLAPLKFTF